MDVGDSEAGSVFIVLREATASADPREGAFNDPTLGQDLEAHRLIGSLDDLDLPRTQCSDGSSCGRSLIAAIGEDTFDEREQAAHGLKHQQAAVAILDAGRMNHNFQQEAERVDQDMSLLAFDLLSRVVTRRCDRRPPFSAPLTLWLSMIAAEGLASLPACSRAATKSV